MLLFAKVEKLFEMYNANLFAIFRNLLYLCCQQYKQWLVYFLSVCSYSQLSKSGKFIEYMRISCGSSRLKGRGLFVLIYVQGSFRNLLS